MKVHEFMHEMQTTSAILGRTSGISVVFEGDQAKTDGKTITLPALPHQADLTTEQVLAMRGFVDHEAGHNRHSDMPRIMSFYDKNHNNDRDDLSLLHNHLEDVWMEDRVLQEYPGSWKNLKQIHELLKAKELASCGDLPPEAITEALKVDRNATVNWSISTNKNEDFRGENNEKLRSYLPEEADVMGKHYVKLVKECENSNEVIELAKKIYQYDEQTPPEEQSPEDFDQKDEAGELNDLAGEENEGENSKGFKEGGDEESREAASRGEAKGAGRKGEGGEEEEDSPEASTDIGETLTTKEEYGHGGGGIGSCMDNGLRGGYRVKTTKHDVYYKRGMTKREGVSDYVVDVVNDLEHWTKYDHRKGELRSDVMVMKNKLRRALMARQQRDWDFGREFGRLDSKRLVAASQGVRQVWKRRTDRQDHDTAISILCDLSGSMHGQKAETARDCAMALSECFEGTNMRYRIAGFSNNGYQGRSSDGTNKYHRYERTDHVIFKDFDDQLRVTRGSVYCIPDAVGGNNSDYDFVDRELFDLSRRPEARKVLFVLSDGHVACYSDAPTSEHERLIRENLAYYKSRFGVESIGIGIQSTSVKSIYPEHVVVQNVGELSGVVFNKLTDLLFREVS